MIGKCKGVTKEELLELTATTIREAMSTLVYESFCIGAVEGRLGSPIDDENCLLARLQRKLGLMPADVSVTCLIRVVEAVIGRFELDEALEQAARDYVNLSPKFEAGNKYQAALKRAVEALDAKR